MAKRALGLDEFLQLVCSIYNNRIKGKSTNPLVVTHEITTSGRDRSMLDVVVTDGLEIHQLGTVEMSNKWLTSWNTQLADVVI